MLRTDSGSASTPDGRGDRSSPARWTARRRRYRRPHPPTASAGRWFRETGWRHIVGVVMLVFSVFPILFVLSASLNPSGTLTGTNALFSAIGLDSYVRILPTPRSPTPRGSRTPSSSRPSPVSRTVFLGALAAYSFSRMRFTGRRFGLISIVVIQMFPQMLAVVAIFLLLSHDRRLLPGARPRLAHRAHHGLPRRRARREHLPHVRVLQHGPRLDRRGGEDRRCRARAHLLHDHPAPGGADPRGRRSCCRSSRRSTSTSSPASC